MAAEPKVLLVWGQYPRWIPPILFSSRQITLTARIKAEEGFRDQSDHDFNYFCDFQPNGWLERGEFDLFEYCQFNKIGTDFDFIIVLSEQDMDIFPTNIQAFNCCSILLIGDTHHFARPISTLVEYALREKFSAAVCQFTAQHLHWFRKAGIPLCGWAPGLVTKHEPSVNHECREDSVVFIGHSWQYHFYRYLLIKLMQTEKLPLGISIATRIEAAEKYGRSLISFNCSLNSDVNIRNFEILSSRGFLLTDELTEASGFNLLFPVGQVCDTYSNSSELISKIDFYRRNPKSALRIARRGHKYFCKNLRADIAISNFKSVYFEGKKSALCLPPDPRFHKVENTNWRKRLLVYEDIQELHRQSLSVRVKVGPNATWFDPGDVEDLPRVKLITQDSTIHGEEYENSSIEESWDYVVN
jgi:hypothetical protein